MIRRRQALAVGESRTSGIGATYCAAPEIADALGISRVASRREIVSPKKRMITSLQMGALAVASHRPASATNTQTAESRDAQTEPRD